MLHKHRTFAAAYVDDMVLHSSSWLDHLFHLGDVLKKLRKAAATQKNLTWGWLGHSTWGTVSARAF